MTPAFLACSFPLRLSPSGQPDGPETSLRVSPDCIGDSAPRSAAHSFQAPGSQPLGTYSGPPVAWIAALGSLPHVSTLSGQATQPYLPGYPSPCGRQHSLLGRSCARPSVDPPHGVSPGRARLGRGYFVPHDRDAVGVGSFSTPGLRCPSWGSSKPPRSVPTIAVEATSGDLT